VTGPDGYGLEVTDGAFELEAHAVLRERGAVVARRPLFAADRRDGDARADVVLELLEALAAAATGEALASGDASGVVLPLADLAAFIAEHPIRPPRDHAPLRPREAPALPPGRDPEGA